MKKCFLLLAIAANIFITQNTNGCPCGFSADNAQPFFEQYEPKNNVIKTNEKEKAHEKDNASDANTTDSASRRKQ